MTGLVLAAFTALVVLGWISVARYLTPKTCGDCGAQLPRRVGRLFRLDPVGKVAYQVCDECFRDRVVTGLGASWPGPVDLTGYSWPGPYGEHETPEQAARAWRMWQRAGRPTIPGLWEGSEQ